MNVSNQNSNGGAISLYETSSRLNLEGNQFTLCRAITGGAIYWNYQEPLNINQNQFSQNQAKEYGNNIASYGVRLEFKSFRFLFTNPISNFISGSNMVNQIIQIHDKYGQRVTTNNGSLLELRITSQSTTFPNKYESSPIFSEQGIFDLTPLRLWGTPGQPVSLSFISPQAIDTSLPEVQFLESQINIQAQLSLCNRGEALDSFGGCTECLPGSYLLIAPKEITECQLCPMNAQCFGGEKLTPKRGFWRAHENTADILDCYNSEACISSTIDNYQPRGHCKQGYEGMLCASCQVGFTQSGPFRCSRCPPQGQNIAIIIIVFFLALVLVVLFINLTLKAMTKKKSNTQVLFKILLNHLQLVTLTASFNLDWPSQVRALFSTAEPISDVSSQVFSFDCFFSSSSKILQQLAQM